ncbi:MAG: DUF2442 domain-containing protein [bacterium]
MKSQKLGENISKPEVTHISSHGFWLYVAEREYFLPFVQYPWFKNATVENILNVTLQHGAYLRWPNLDVDLELESLKHPEKYPLVYR